MAPKCTICHHPEREAIEQALRSGTPYRHIASQHDTSTASLRRHKEHMLQEVAQGLPAVPEEPKEVIIARKAKNAAEELYDLRAKLYSLLERAEEEQNLQAQIFIIREIKGLVDTIIKVGLAQKELELQKHGDVSPEIMAMVEEVIDG